MQIEKIINGGYGFCRLASGQVVLVRHVLPGETVSVTTEEQKKNYLVGQLRQIITPHAARRQPPCPYYGACGGCDLQHGDYRSQLEIKKTIIVDLILRSGLDKRGGAATLLAAPLPSPEEFGYRQRLRLQAHKGVLGFHRYQSHSLLPIQACLLAAPPLNQSLGALKTLDDGRKLTSAATEVELQTNPITGRTVVIVRLRRKPRPAEIQAAGRFAAGCQAVERIFFAGDQFAIMGPYGDVENVALGSFLGVDYPAVAGLPGELRLRWEAGGFCQVNLLQNRHLIETVLNFCQVEKGQSILDLYCGMGNFSLPLALQGAGVLGIEGQGSAIRSAVHNAGCAGLTNISFQQNPIDSACSHLVADNARFDCIVLDPPRQGGTGLAARLAALCRKKLVYISCDPATLCRDLTDLLAQGFFLRKIQPIDMFPQTHHIETVVLLEK